MHIHNEYILVGLEEWEENETRDYDRGFIKVYRITDESFLYVSKLDMPGGVWRIGSIDEETIVATVKNNLIVLNFTEGVLSFVTMCKKYTYITALDIYG